MVETNSSTKRQASSRERHAESFPPITSLQTPLEHTQALWPGFALGHPYGNKSVLRNRTDTDKTQTGEQLFRRSNGASLVGHQGARCDELLFVRSNTSPTDRIADIEEIKKYLGRLEGQEDKFISVNTFYGRRQHKNLRALTAIIVDLDLMIARDRGRDYQTDFVRQRQDALDLITQAGIPVPNFAVQSGKGVHLYWLFDQIVPAAAYPRWRACQIHLIDLLRNVGADNAVKDTTRVLRLVGTINPTAPPYCRRVTAEIFQPVRYSFDFLADQILPLTRAQLDAQRAMRRAKLAELAPLQAQKRATVHLSGRRLGRRYSATAMDRLGDLSHLAKTLYPNGIDQGKRDRYLFAAAVHLAWVCRAETLEGEILRWKNEHIGSMSDEEACATMATAIDRAQEAYRDMSAGCIKSVYDDSRYVISAKTMWEQFGADITLANLADQMKGIVPASVLAERKKAAQRAKSADHYTGHGVRTSNVEKARQAHELKGQGLRAQEISLQLGVSSKTVYGWLRIEPGALGLSAGTPAAPPRALPPPPPSSYPQAVVKNNASPKSSLNNGVAERVRGGPSLMGPAFVAEILTDSVPNVIRPAMGVRTSLISDTSPPNVRSTPESRLWKHPNSKVAALRQLSISETLDRLGLYYKRDNSYHPKENQKSQRVHVTLAGGYVIELIYTDLVWFDKTQGHGAYGSIDLVMHLMGWTLKDTLDKLI